MHFGKTPTSTHPKKQAQKKVEALANVMIWSFIPLGVRKEPQRTVVSMNTLRGLVCASWRNHSGVDGF